MIAENENIEVSYRVLGFVFLGGTKTPHGIFVFRNHKLY
jgi:hypothetical protein